jgi:hypothetical protein
VSETVSPAFDPAAIDAVLQRLRATPPGSAEELDRIHRRLLRETHPDRSGGDASTFLYLQEQIARYRLEWEVAHARHTLETKVDRHVLLEELGLSPELPPRAALLAALYRFRALGLFSWRLRSRASLRKRNGRVLHTVLGWAYEYDPEFVPVFYRFLASQANVPISEGQAPLHIAVRRMILKGLDGLIRYQDLQREATAAIARDTLLYAIRISPQRPGREGFADLHDFARWILRELDHDPTPVGLSW